MVKKVLNPDGSILVQGYWKDGKLAEQLPKKMILLKTIQKIEKMKTIRIL